MSPPANDNKRSPLRAGSCALASETLRSPFRAGPHVPAAGQLKKNTTTLSGLALNCLLPGARKTPARAGPHVPYAGRRKRPSLRPYLLHPWPPASLCIWCRWGSRDPSSHTTSAPGPHRARPKSSKAASGPDSCGRTTRRGGDKTKAEPQGRGD